MVFGLVRGAIKDARELFLDIKHLLTQKIVEELLEFVVELDGIATWPQPEIVVETIEGELYEVGGNWRQSREKLRTPNAKPESKHESPFKLFTGGIFD